MLLPVPENSTDPEVYKQFRVITVANMRKALDQLKDDDDLSVNQVNNLIVSRGDGYIAYIDLGVNEGLHFL